MKVDKGDDNLPFLGIHSGLTKLSHYKQTDLREWVGRGAVEREETLERERKKKSKNPNGLCDANRHNLRMFGKSTRSLRSLLHIECKNSVIMNTMIQLENL